MGFPCTLGLAVSALALRATCMAIAPDASSNIEARQSWSYLGCFTDNVSGRALPNGQSVPGSSAAMTNELCQSACDAAGFILSGTEYSGECCKTYLIFCFVYFYGMGILLAC